MVQMRFITCTALAGAVAFTLAAPAAAQRSKPGPVHKRPMTQAQTQATPAALPCGDVLGFQVLLDTQGISAGEIDGKAGPNFTRALDAFQAAASCTSAARPTARRGTPLASSGAQGHAAPGGNAAGAATVSYTITEDDVNGPFAGKIPPSLPDQASLPALGYPSLTEQLAERFHTSPALLQQLNPGARFDAGTTIDVPAVQPFDAAAPRPATDPAAGDFTVTVSKGESALRVTRADGTLVFFAPVTTGSEKIRCRPATGRSTASAGGQPSNTTRISSGTQSQATERQR